MNKAAPYKTLLPLMILLGLGLLMAGSASDAIDLKDPVNLNQLGYALVIKDSTQVDLARTYFSKAAALNYPASIYNLAVLDDIEGKYPHAAQGYLKAAKLMLPEAACQIGLIYSVGIGLPQNDLLAYRWLLFGSAYASDQERDFWLDLKDDVATRLSQTEIRTIQNEVSELAQKQTLVGDEGRKEIIFTYNLELLKQTLAQRFKNNLPRKLSTVGTGTTESTEQPKPAEVVTPAPPVEKHFIMLTKPNTNGQVAQPDTTGGRMRLPY